MPMQKQMQMQMQVQKQMRNRESTGSLEEASGDVGWKDEGDLGQYGALALWRSGEMAAMAWREKNAFQVGNYWPKFMGNQPASMDTRDVSFQRASGLRRAPSPRAETLDLA